jgi:Uma2 family endonuclease
MKDNSASMVIKSPATEADLRQMPDDGYKYELVDGEIIASPSGFYSSAVATRISHLLQLYTDKNPVGLVAGADVGIRLPDGNVRSPDASVVRIEKLPEGKPPITFGAFAPDLAVEVLSPSDSHRLVADKIGEYLQCGVSLVWLVDPEAKTVTVFRSLTDVQQLKSGDTITADPVLPGFSCAVDRFFYTS